MYERVIYIHDIRDTVIVCGVVHCGDVRERERMRIRERKRSGEKEKV